MAVLLHIQASPLPGRSYSIQVTNAFVAAYIRAHPNDEVRTLNVFTAALPDFDGMAVSAKYATMSGHAHTEEELSAWRAVEALANDFKAADKYVFAVPMWNFGIPYRLKQYLDLIIQPGLTFSFSPQNGYLGLVVKKPALLVYARGGNYSEPGAEDFDFQKRYMETALGFMGFTDLQSIVVEPTRQGGMETARLKRDAAITQAEKLALSF